MTDLTPQNRSRRRELAALFRQIGEEIIEGSGVEMTRVEALVRVLYRDAFEKGDKKAIEMILERGWGKVPTPIEVDARGKIQDMIETSGVPLEVIARDPTARSLAEAAGYTFDQLPAPTPGNSGQLDAEAGFGPVSATGPATGPEESEDPVES